MKVLYFHQYFTTPAFGGGTRSYEMARALIRQGHEVTMVCGQAVNLGLPVTGIRNVRRGIIDCINVIQIALPYSNNDGLVKRTVTFFRFAVMGVKIALREDYDLLFATSTPLTAGIPGIAAKIWRKKRFVFEVRDLWPEIPRALGLKNPVVLTGMSILEWLTYRKADGCIALSPGIREGIQKRSPEGKPVAMIPNGCDLELFSPEKRDRNSSFLGGIGLDDTVAVFTGAHGVANGLDAVLDAAGELKKMGRDDIALAFIGEGKVKKHLIERSEKEGLTNCRFFNQMSKNDLAKITASADIGLMVLHNVHAFYYGTSPNKFFDYIAAGLPVLNNYPGWLADMIGENRFGIVVPPGDPAVFAGALIELADNKEYRKQAGINARKFAKEHFARETLAKQFVSFLEEIAGLSVSA